jgi:hypothetical protein
MGLTEAYVKYKEDNRNYDLYRDPYHAGKEIKEKVINSVWRDQNMKYE